METTTANSGALSELRETKIPTPDAEFFSAFVPELVFAAVVGIIVALAYAFVHRIAEDAEGAESEKTQPLPKKPAHEALAKLEALSDDDPEFASKVWSIVRTYLSETYGNPFFPNMTASEAVRAAGDREGLSGLATLARELEYSALAKRSDKRSDLRVSAAAFVTSEK